MNIKEAKEELIHTVRAYTAKDENGAYRIPGLRQRPILLMGPPGIGKTAIMEQVAELSGIGLVSYTMTHHTRQSAVGLPLIKKQLFQGKEYEVTEYTMSEIIASMYRMMEISGKKEGILFLDEINCVSETLAPTMLQFLQNKTFGSHRIPEGWIIVAAGNPAEYNKSVREFDVVTLDRVRRLTIEPDVEVWLSYAAEKGVHGSILSYLRWKKEQFYHIRKNADGMEFVTARGWEDLSVLLTEYEALGIPVEEFTIGEYLQTEVIARDFYAFYQMFGAVGRRLSPVLPALIKGQIPEEMREECSRMPIDERFCMTQVLLSGMQRELAEWEERKTGEATERELLENFRIFSGQNPGKEPMELLKLFLERQRHSLEVQRDAGILKEERIRTEQNRIRMIENWSVLFGQALPHGEKAGEELLVKRMERLGEEKDLLRDGLEKRLGALAGLLEQIFGEGSELIYYITGIMKCHAGMEFLKEKQPDFLEKYGELLLVDREEERLRRLLSSVKG